jgi:hypothetical protein
MNVVKPSKPEDMATATAVEGDIREFVQREVTPPRNPNKPRLEVDSEPVKADSINAMVDRASRGSVRELDNLIFDLQRVRDHLTVEGERIQRAITKYIQTSDTTMETVKVMTDSMVRWKDNGSSQDS